MLLSVALSIPTLTSIKGKVPMNPYITALATYEDLFSKRTESDTCSRIVDTRSLDLEMLP